MNDRAGASPGEGEHPRAEEPMLITPSMLAAPPRVERIDFERGMSTLPPFVLTLIAVLVAVFVWELATGALANQATIIYAGALVRYRVVSGEYWRLLTGTLLHGGWAHLIGNCLVLYVVGMGCEHALGAARTAAVYFTSAIAGSVMSATFTPGPSVGASGAVFGVTAAVIVVLYRHRDRFYFRDNRVSAVLAVWAAYQIATGLSSPLIDNFAHIGGFAGGALAAGGMRPRLLASTRGVD